MCVCFAGVLSLLFLLLSCVSDADVAEKKIPSSCTRFHQGYECTDSVQQGILDELAPRRKDVSLSVEYLDSIRYPEASHLEAVHELFCELPVVFCGVNEAISVRETIEIALKLRPSAKTVAVVAGSGPRRNPQPGDGEGRETFLQGKSGVRVSVRLRTGGDRESPEGAFIGRYRPLPLLPSLPFREKALGRGEQDVCPRGTPFFFTRPGADWPRPGTSSSSTRFFSKELFSKHGAPMLIIDPESRLILAGNQAAHSFYGFPELQGMMIDRINALSPQQVREEMQKATGLRKNHFDFRHRLADVRYAMCGSTPTRSRSTGERCSSPW